MQIVKLVVIVVVLALSGWSLYDWYKADRLESQNALEQSQKNTEGKDEKNQIHKWKDAEGIVHYTNDANSIPEKYRKKAAPVDLPDLNVLDESAASNLLLSGKKNIAMGKGDIRMSKRVLFYTTENCPTCLKVRQLLDKLEVGYAEMNPRKDPRALRVLMTTTGGSADVPVVVIDDNVITGYQPEELLRLLPTIKMNNK